MTKNITFGWRVPDFPEYGADSLAFRAHIFHFMDLLNGAGWNAVWAGSLFPLGGGARPGDGHD